MRGGIGKDRVQRMCFQLTGGSWGGREVGRGMIGKTHLRQVWRDMTDWSWRGRVHCLVSQLGENLEWKREMKTLA